jgi:hypothetical protein
VPKHTRVTLSSTDSKGESKFFGEPMDLDLLYQSINKTGALGREIYEIFGFGNNGEDR